MPAVPRSVCDAARLGGSGEPLPCLSVPFLKLPLSSPGQLAQQKKRKANLRLVVKGIVHGEVKVLAGLRWVGSHSGQVQTVCGHRNRVR